MDNYASVVHQMEQFGVEFVQSKDLPLKIDLPKRKGCGKGGKWWYWLRTFRPDSGGCLIVGRFGSYKSGTSEKVEIDWKPMAEADRKRAAAERAAAKVAADAARQKEAALAALSANELWRMASKAGDSPYLERKSVVGESCRWLTEPMTLRWEARDPTEDDVVIRLPIGTLVVPLIRYDWPKQDALRGLQFIRPDGSKIYTRGLDKPGCAVRLGEVPEDAFVILVCEGYATGGSIRLATERLLPVYVALDAGNLQYVVAMVRKLHPESRILICADDDYLTRNNRGDLENVGRKKARAVAKETERTDIVYPIFDTATRGRKDTDFNDLHARQGLEAVRRQIGWTLLALRHRHG